MTAGQIQDLSDSISVQHLAESVKKKDCMLDKIEFCCTH